MYEYNKGGLVERISSGARLPFVRNAGKQIHVLASENENARTMVAWPASDCRPAVDHAAELAAKDAEIEKLRGLQFSPIGDNHHNAWACPHCNPSGKTPKQMDDDIAAKDARIAELEAENEALRCHHSDADRALGEWHK